MHSKFLLMTCFSKNSMTMHVLSEFKFYADNINIPVIATLYIFVKYFAHSEFDSSFIKEYVSFYDTLSDLVKMNVEFEFIEK